MKLGETAPLSNNHKSPFPAEDGISGQDLTIAKPLKLSRRKVLELGGMFALTATQLLNPAGAKAAKDASNMAASLIGGKTPLQLDSGEYGVELEQIRPGSLEEVDATQKWMRELFTTIENTGHPLLIKPVRQFLVAGGRTDLVEGKGEFVLTAQEQFLPSVIPATHWNKASQSPGEGFTPVSLVLNPSDIPQDIEPDNILRYRFTFWTDAAGQPYNAPSASSYAIFHFAHKMALVEIYHDRVLASDPANFNRDILADWPDIPSQDVRDKAEAYSKVIPLYGELRPSFSNWGLKQASHFERLHASWAALPQEEREFEWRKVINSLPATVKKAPIEELR